jgi:hypothetical protein
VLWAMLSLPSPAESASNGCQRRRSSSRSRQPLPSAASAGVAPEPPLVKIADGAADLYADLFDSSGDGSGGLLLKTQVAEVNLCGIELQG